MRVHEGHQQKPILLEPAWSGKGNAPMRALIERKLSLSRQNDDQYRFNQVEQDCLQLEKLLQGSIHDATLYLGLPSVQQFDQFGQRVDILKTSEGWRRLKRVAAEQGIVSVAFERPIGQDSRIWMFLKTYLWSPESGYVGCPMAMTDGCARVIEIAGTPQMKRDILPRLISRDPDFAWTAGQWMTEKPGGSDVSLTETVARRVSTSSNEPQPGDEYIIDGFKWFSSATDGDVALALARTGTPESGSRGLSLFLIKLRDDKGQTNGIFIHRLKNKWGTKYLPTAELEINGAKGQLVGKPGQGVRIIASVLNITRTHSAVGSCSALRRSLDIAKSFAQVRHVGGSKGSLLSMNEMHTNALAQSELTHRALIHFVFELVQLLGRSEVDIEQTSKNDLMRLRLLTPVAKTFAANLSTNEMLKLLESLGGQGYMEENALGPMIADVSVERIWEGKSSGTTNTLALDVVRVIVGTKGQAIEAFVHWSSQILTSLPNEWHFKSELDHVNKDVELLIKAAREYNDPTKADPRLARVLLYHIGYLASSTCLIEHAIWSSKQNRAEAEVDRVTASRWIQHGDARTTSAQLQSLLEASSSDRRFERQMDSALVYGPRSDSKL
ncbi:hypothetical protein OIO90_003153 [Microbotryomycetes sp. JL221]|nr:hypothetical protein OIO90_003153 [Microbotryomycetes sp. JL221]